MKSAPLLLLTLLLLSACGNNETKEKETTPAVVSDKAQAEADTASNIAAPVTSLDADTTTAPAPAEGLLLRFNLPKGKLYQQTTSINADQQMGGNRMNTGMTWGYDMKTLQESKSEKTVSVTFRRIAMSMDMGGQKMEISSDSKQKATTDGPLGMMLTVFKGMTGKSFNLILDGNGKIKRVEGFDAIATSMVNEMNLPAERREKVLQVYQNQFNEGMVKDIFSQSMEMMPGKKVKKGDSWTAKTQSKMGRNTTESIMTYTVKNIRGNKVELSATGRAEVEEQQLTSKGSYIVDAISGVILSGQLEQQLGGSMKATSRVTITGKAL